MLTYTQQEQAREALLGIKNSYGSYAALAESLNKLIKTPGDSVSFQAVHKWYKQGVIPADRVPLLAKLSKGEVDMATLRPDLFNA